MSKTVQEIMEVMGKTVEATMKLERKSGSSYAHIADINSEDINEIRYYFDGALYRSVMRCLEVKLKGDWTAKAKKGLLLDSLNLTVTHPEGDSVTIGYGGFYIAEAPEYDAAQNLTSIIAYDELYQSMRPYAESLWQSGITVKNYLIAVLNKLGINYDANSLNLMANADKAITSEKYLDIENDSTETAYTYRDILDEIAKASGVTFAFRNSLRGDPFKLYAIKPTESGYVIDESNLRSVTIGAKYGPVKGVVLSREPQEDNVYYPSNLSDSQTAVKISNVELIEDSDNDEYRKQFAKGIYDNVVDTEYYLYELDSFGIGFLNFGDIFTLKVCERTAGTIGDEKSYKTIFMRTDMTVGDGIKEKSKLEAPQATSTDYSAAESATDKKLKKAMLKVDKQNQRIESYITDNDSRYTKITQTLEGLDVAINDEESGLKAQMTATAEKAESAYSMASTIINAGYTTTDDVNTLISQSANDITLSVERNLKIGARNILLDSACFESFTPKLYYANSSVSGITVDNEVPSGISKRINYFVEQEDLTKYSGVIFTDSDILGKSDSEDGTESKIQRIKSNTKYTLSFWLKSNFIESGKTTNLSKDSMIYVGDQATVTIDESRCVWQNVSNNWKKFVLVFTINGTFNTFLLRFLFDGLEYDEPFKFFLSSLKLEEGNVATDWSPSAEDIDQSVKAQISMCVQKDKDNKLTSAIAIEGNMISIKSENFELAADGTITKCQGATITNGIIQCGDGSTAMIIGQGAIVHKFDSTEVGDIGLSMNQDSSGNIQYYERISGTVGVEISANNYAAFVDDEGFVVCSNARDTTINVGISSTTDWSYESYSSALRSIVEADSALIISANRGGNGLYLEGSSIVMCGQLTLPHAIGTDSSTSYVYVVADKKTGQIGYLPA